MKKTFSRSWKGSSQRRKQRKYVHRTPLHLRTTQLTASLHKSLREKYKVRNLPVRKGDAVKIMRGSFTGTESKVERVDRKERRVFLEKMRVTRRDGSEVPVSVAVSNVQIVGIEQDDRRRFAASKTEKTAVQKTK